MVEAGDSGAVLTISVGLRTTMCLHPWVNLVLTEQSIAGPDKPTEYSKWIVTNSFGDLIPSCNLSAFSAPFCPSDNLTSKRSGQMRERHRAQHLDHAGWKWKMINGGGR